MAITYQSSHPHYYKRLSEYQMSVDCNMSSNGDYDIIKLKSIMMHSACCEEHSNGFAPPKDAIVKTVKYPGFSVVALGVPRNIWLPDLPAFELMRRDLRHNDHMLVYWDDRSIAFITDKKQWVPVFEDFLTNKSVYQFIQGAGLYVSL